ncbi:poly-beta-1,6 N-acetyl-D-glucosamine export porin PgaA [Scandinavium sp. TWS1a]|uniref:poly-beta-1,6 N-acetyl-D-glucosamine export porin PgaA n=1 Tax=Scandinavium tedordense TaxID=2926521 RepID=UPI002165313E|nr:poly-beta-1,6 N-acetyl-D-glucosamine export porin PgaA [Scandinavium tedordense]MCS2169584.1 poly-beta-1,6 N-acetyl-D-glucosamine export porin PgaA [Scandinavium tedordense]
MRAIARISTLRRYSVISLAVSLCLACTFPARADDGAYDKKVLLARDGQTAPLLNWLQQRAQHAPLTESQVADWLQVSGWAGHDADVISLWRRYSPKMAIPTWGVAAAAQAYRNQQQWDVSLVLWDKARKMSPDDDDIRARWVMTLADARHDKQALYEAQRLVRDAPSAYHYQLLAYAWRAQGKSRDSLLSLTLAWQNHQQGKAFKTDLLAAWDKNHIAFPALRLSRSMNISAAASRQLELKAAAVMVRNARTTTHGEAEHYVVADQVLARYDSLLAQWKNNPDAQADIRQARIDRLGALLTRQRFAEVTDEYQPLTADGKPVPDYAKRWVASAWLAQMRPDKAHRLFNDVYKKVSPATLLPDDQQEMFYASIENEDFPAAKCEAERIIADSPYNTFHYGSPVPQPNDSWLNGRLLMSQYLQMANRLPEAEQYARHLARSGPGNQGLLINYASVLAARGLPRAAERELKLAEPLEPSNPELERQQAEVAMDLQEWRQMDLLTDDLVARNPDAPDILQLERDRDLQNGYELRITGDKGISSDSPISGSHDFTLKTALYGPRIADHWRPFAGFNYATGEFDEGKGSNRDVLGGVEYTSRDNWAELELSNRNFAGGNKLGVRFSGWHDVNDNWHIGGSAQRMSSETPLRALRNGITSNGGDLWVRWYQSERREYQLTLAPQWFSDGNTRMALNFTGKERLWTTPHFTLDFTPDISASSNSKTDTPYYNPKRDLAILPALSAEQILYRRYNTVWSQLFTAGLGAYVQKGEKNGAITTLGYGQRIQWNNQLDMDVMLTWDKRPYDGTREKNLGVAFDLNYRFGGH